MAFAKMGAAFVVSACGALDEGTLAALDVTAEHADRLRRPENTGGSMIVGPDGQILAGPLEGVEGIVVVERRGAVLVGVAADGGAWGGEGAAESPAPTSMGSSCDGGRGWR